jgi:hypothetical protein
MDVAHFNEQADKKKALSELGKASKLLHQLIIAACTAMIAFALTPDPADNYRKALTEVQTLEGLTREHYSRYVLNRLQGRRKELADFDKTPFTEPGPNFLVNKYTVQPATYISWPTDAPIAEVVAFYEGNNEAVQYGPGEERELRSAISTARQDVSQPPIPRAASLQDADLVVPSNVARIHIGDLYLLEKRLAAEARPIEVRLSYDSDTEKGSSDTARYTPPLHSIEEYRLSHVNLALDWLRSQDTEFQRISATLSGRTILFPGIKNALSEIEASPLRAATGKLQDKIDSMRHDIHFLGLTIEERIAIWAGPAILLAVLLYFYAHFYEFARVYRELSPVTNQAAWVVVLPGQVSSSLSYASIAAMPVLACGLLLWRLGHLHDANTAVGATLCLAVALTTVLCVRTLAELRSVTSVSRGVGGGAQLDAGFPGATASEPLGLESEDPSVSNVTVSGSVKPHDGDTS